MITFTLCLLALIVGYFTYGRLMERVFGPDDRKTPALTKADGVDYIPLPTWKIFMIQFLNIAGLGPIFGAIMGAKFGSSSYLWIVLGSIFAGAVHDYFAGMLSLRNGGESLPEIIGRYLGLTTKQVMRGFTVILMILNNFRNSSFWLKNTSFFRMKNVELSYTFNQFSPSSVVKKMKVFARGANLFVLSSVKDLDPELLNAGVTNYPVTRTFTGGVSFVF